MALAYTEERDSGPRASPEVVRPARGARVAVALALPVVLAVGVVARFVTGSELWLDEALSVNIAERPLTELPALLRADGSPPLFYLLLHLWTAELGSSEFVARALSGLFGVVALPLVWAVGRRYGSRVAWTAVALAAVNPFAIRYATEARMYSMVMVAVLAGWLSLDRILRGGGRAAQVGLALSTAALIHLHYWSFYLLATVGTMLFVAHRRPGPAHERGPARALMAMAWGAASFVVWLPSFLQQLSSTGTPWGVPGTPRSLVDAITAFAGGFDQAGVLGGTLFLVMILVAVFVHPLNGHLVIETRARGEGTVLATVVFGTMLLGVVAGQLSNSAFAIRYASVVFPVFIVLVALGVDRLAGRRAFPVMVVALVVIGAWSTTDNLRDTRTTAGVVAFHLRSLASSGDVVAYCPDQLGPSVSRLVAQKDLEHVTYPRKDGPELVDWRDYTDVIEQAPVGEFARYVDDLAGDRRSVWLVWAPGYRGLGSRCQSLVTQLENLRPDHQEVRISTSGYFEKAQLMRFRPSSPDLVVA